MKQLNEEIDDVKANKNVAIEIQPFEYSTTENTLLTPTGSVVSSNQYPRHFGKNFVFLFGKSGEPLIVIGPHWPFFLCMSSIILVVGIVTAEKVALNRSHYNYLLMYGLTFLELLVYSFTALINPGIASKALPLNQELIDTNANYCRPCKSVRAMNTVHCYDCDVCIEGHDHHCVWTGKCIGKGNICAFYLFLLTTVIYMVSTAIIASM